ncbi:MAG TPA: GNAT family N-acetyltransferase [Gemmatimonadales bacterium]|nr:GNAT family N-acetyltransferase [Gemmatimonadales bacterium]
MKPPPCGAGAAAPPDGQVIWRDPEFEVELFEALGPARARCEALLAAAGLALPAPHRTAWAELWPGRSQWFLAVRASGGGYQAGFAVEVSRSRVMLGHWLLRVERFGAMLSGAAGAAGLRALAHLARSRPRVLRVYVEVYCEDPARRHGIGRLLGELGFRPAAHLRAYQDTVLVDLAPAEDAILASFHRSTRRNIRWIATQPFEVRAIRAPAPVARMAALVAESLARTGGRAAPEDWAAVTALSERCPELSRLAGLFRADTAGPDSLVAFVWGLNHGTHVENPVTGMTRVAGSRAPLTYALIWDLIGWAKRVGARWFDFGGVTAGHRGEGDALGGISDFKRGFSSTVVAVGEEWTLEPHVWRGQLATALSSLSAGVSRSVRAAGRRIARLRAGAPSPEALAGG